MNLGKYVDLVSQLFEPAYIVDAERTILFWNEAAEKMTGYQNSMVTGKKCYDNIMVHINEQGEKLCKVKCPLDEVIREGKATELVFYLQHRTGHRIPVNARVIPLTNDAGVVVGAVEVFVKKGQIAESAKPSILKELVTAAYVDSVTSLPNKEYMENKVKKLLVANKENPYDIAVGLLALEVQNLREFNELGGMVAGNVMLTVLAKTLSSNVEMEKDATVCKWYGGSFVIIMNTNKISMLLNWANKFKILLEKSKVTGYEEEAIKVVIGGVAAKTGESAQDVLRRLEEQLQISKSQTSGISVG